MEKIIINQLLYTLPNGTNKKISALLKKGDKAPAMAHENGTAHNEFDAFLWDIIETKQGTYIENVYQTT